MRKMNIEDYNEFYRDSVEFIESLATESPDLFQEVSWLLDEEPYLIILYNARVPITKWLPMTERDLLSVTGFTYTELQLFKRDANKSIETNWGVVSSGTDGD